MMRQIADAAIPVPMTTSSARSRAPRRSRNSSAIGHSS
jgi:hypothetical protein